MQNAYPELPAGLREQIISGTHPACFDALFADDEPAGAVLMSEIFGPDDGPSA